MPDDGIHARPSTHVSSPPAPSAPTCLTIFLTDVRETPFSAGWLITRGCVASGARSEKVPQKKEEATRLTGSEQEIHAGEYTFSGTFLRPCFSVLDSLRSSSSSPSPPPRVFPVPPPVSLLPRVRRRLIDDPVARSATANRADRREQKCGPREIFESVVNEARSVLSDGKLCRAMSLSVAPLVCPIRFVANERPPSRKSQ